MASLKGKYHGWLENVDDEPQTRIWDTVLVRVPNKAQKIFKRQLSAEVDHPRTGEDYCSIRYRSFRERSIRPKMYSERSKLKRASFFRSNTKSTKARSSNLLSSKTMGGTVRCCCWPRVSGACPVTVPLVKSTKKEKLPEVHVNEEYCKPPYWKQLISLLKEQAHSRHFLHHHSRYEWQNYDLESYLLNFDDGSRRENHASSAGVGSGVDPAERARAMHTAFLKRFSASRAENGS